MSPQLPPRAQENREQAGVGLVDPLASRQTPEPCVQLCQSYLDEFS